MLLERAPTPFSGAHDRVTMRPLRPPLQRGEAAGVRAYLDEFACEKEFAASPCGSWSGAGDGSDPEAGPGLAWPAFGLAPPAFGLAPPAFGFAPSAVALEPPAFEFAPPVFGFAPLAFEPELVEPGFAGWSCEPWLGAAACPCA